MKSLNRPETGDRVRRILDRTLPVPIWPSRVGIGARP
jgi:hypothetical protein